MSTTVNGYACPTPDDAPDVPDSFAKFANSLVPNSAFGGANKILDRAHGGTGNSEGKAASADSATVATNTSFANEAGGKVMAQDSNGGGHYFMHTQAWTHVLPATTTSDVGGDIALTGYNWDTNMWTVFVVDIHATRQDTGAAVEGLVLNPYVDVNADGAARLRTSWFRPSGAGNLPACNLHFRHIAILTNAMGVDAYTG